MSSHRSVRSLMTRLAALVLAALLAASSLTPCPAGLTPRQTESSAPNAGMGTPAGPIVSPVVVPAPVALGGSPLVTPTVVAASRLAAGERVAERAVRRAF